MIEKGQAYKIVLFKDFKTLDIKGVVEDVDSDFIKIADKIINKKFIFSLEKIKGIKKQ